MTRDNFKSPCNTIKLLLRTNAIPFLVVNYTRKSLTVLLNRFKVFVLCETTYTAEGVSLKILPVFDDELDGLILDATRLTVDYNIITDSMFEELLQTAFSAGEIMRSKLIKIDNSKGTGFTESDYTTLSRIAAKAKLVKDFWSLED